MHPLRWPDADPSLQGPCREREVRVRLLNPMVAHGDVCAMVAGAGPLGHRSGIDPDTGCIREDVLEAGLAGRLGESHLQSPCGLTPRVRRLRCGVAVQCWKSPR